MVSLSSGVRCSFSQFLWEHELPWAVRRRQLRRAHGRCCALEAGGCEMHKPPPSRGRVAEAGLPTGMTRSSSVETTGPLAVESPPSEGWVLCELLGLAHSLAHVA